MDNPFLDDFPELVTLDIRNCAHESVVATVHTVDDTGKKQYQDVVKNVRDVCSHYVHDPIKKNSLALFTKAKHMATSKKGKKSKCFRTTSYTLFGQLYIPMQNRDGDLAEFFAHDIQSFLQSLSDFGKLHATNPKSELLQCLEPSEPPSTYDCTVLDGAVIVHCLPTTSFSTFNEYADRVFIPYLQKQLQAASRLDVVWDTYV